MLTKIPWVEHSVNPIRVKGGKVWPYGYHCMKVSPGCAHCYAEGLNIMRGTGLPFDDRKVEFYVSLSAFDDLPKNKSVTVFVQSMGDVFHEGISNDQITAVYDRAYMSAAAYNHRFLILTKRPERALEWYRKQGFNENYHPTFIWLGVTAENQEQADKRIPILLQIPAAKRFVSIEPMLGAVDIQQYLNHRPDLCGCESDHEYCPHQYDEYLDWVIVGAESGAGRRECKTEWVRDIVGQCKAAEVPVFVKQLSLLRIVKCFKHNTRRTSKLSKNRDEWPEDLRVQEYPG